MKTSKIKTILPVVILLMALAACKKDGEYLNGGTITSLQVYIRHMHDTGNVYRIQYGETILADSITKKVRDGMGAVTFINETGLKDRLKIWRLENGKTIPEMDTLMDLKPGQLLNFLQPGPGAQLQLTDNYTTIKTNLWLAPNPDYKYLVKFGNAVIGSALTTSDRDARIDSGWVALSGLKDYVRVWKLEDGVPATLLLEKEMTLEPGQTISMAQPTDASPVGIFGNVEAPDARSKTNFICTYEGLLRETPHGDVPGYPLLKVYIAGADFDDIATNYSGKFEDLDLDTVAAFTIRPNELSEVITLDVDLFKNPKKMPCTFYYSIRDAETNEMLVRYDKNAYISGLSERGSIQAFDQLVITQLMSYGWDWPGPPVMYFETIGSTPW
ncbi:hypothetical protein [Chitinophaga barathri]|uniref:DUF4249 family protein n=1 Tax=Chitinophaga barathri TaxID=1647451 RepID=A0A3N4MDH7_9BACT|nr:hypothetical protein [Chitinophaga barathri]RPD41485.1 hypothetical protein EG028_09205 [Chitinophaga barathri]